MGEMGEVFMICDLLVRRVSLAGGTEGVADLKGELQGILVNNLH